jgi:hypothetical protein
MQSETQLNNIVQLKNSIPVSYLQFVCQIAYLFQDLDKRMDVLCIMPKIAIVHDLAASPKPDSSCERYIL